MSETMREGLILLGIIAIIFAITFGFILVIR